MYSVKMHSDFCFVQEIKKFSTKVKLEVLQRNEFYLFGIVAILV